jgi:excisionase family DNA binding protein
MQDASLTKLLRPDELSLLLGVPKVTIYTWVRRGVLPFVQLERCIRFDPEEIRTWVKERKKPARYRS